MSYKLEHSPHLRPVDMERPHIPYNFRTYSGSQTSVQPDGVSPSPRNVLRKKRSSYETGTPQRKRSNRSRRDEQVREEEIRAMSTPSPIPKRPGEGPLRRDSKKLRSGMKGSNISLPPPEESLHEAMPDITEQRGWEIGSLGIFNPRPAVRLSGTPQYVTSSSLRSGSPISPEPPRKLKERLLPGRDSKKRETIGSRADDLDASDLRMLLERDAKRREKRKKDQQEKLDRNLRNREGRNRGDSDRKRHEAEELRRAEEARQRAEEELRAHELMQPPQQPTDIHPALRNGQRDVVGLGIEEDQAAAGAGEAPFEDARDVVTAKEHPEHPFTDPSGEHDIRTSTEQMPGAFTPAESHNEEPILGTAKEVRMSQASTPPLSPVHSTRAKSRLSEIANTRPASEAVPAPVPVNEPRRASQPAPERRVGALASLFRRGGTNARKGSEPKSPSEVSFSNASRESMRNQPLPPHLVDTQPRMPVARGTSGTPVRTQSKFREDLPEMPISPPDSRVASPEASTPVTGRAPPSQPIDVPSHGSTATAGSESQAAPRYDTPISPSLRHGASLASVDSEGAWLASGSTKRQSKSGIAQRRPEFSASYEELGADTDPQYFSRATASPETLRAPAPQWADSAALPGASETTSEREFFDAPEEIETPGEEAAEPSTPTVHESVRRQPTLVQRDPRVRSREGLLDEYAGDPEPTSATETGRGSFELDSDPEAPEPELIRASSVRMHQHKSSTGSARLLDVTPRRGSAADLLGEGSEPTTPSKL